eukprot:gene15903-7236_t
MSVKDAGTNEDPCSSNVDRAPDDELAVGLLCADDPPADETFAQEYRVAYAERDAWLKRYPIDSKGRWTSQNGANVDIAQSSWFKMQKNACVARKSRRARSP